MAVNKWMLALIVLALAVAVPLLCIAAERMAVPAYGNGSVVLVEHLEQSRGRLISGAYPASSLDGAGYRYDATERRLDAEGLEVNDSLRAVLCVAASLAQDAGSGVASRAHGVYAIPASAGGISLEALAPDGTVTLAYNGSKIALSPGERWEDISTETVITPDYSIRLTRTDSIRNDGFVAKASIN